MNLSSFSATWSRKTAIVGVQETPPDGEDGRWDGEWQSDEEASVVLVAAAKGHTHSVAMVFNSMEMIEEFCAGLTATGDAIFNNGGRPRVPPRRDAN